jgi:hypothetical protein
VLERVDRIRRRAATEGQSRRVNSLAIMTP